MRPRIPQRQFWSSPSVGVESQHMCRCVCLCACLPARLSHVVGCRAGSYTCAFARAESCRIGIVWVRTHRVGDCAHERGFHPAPRSTHVYVTVVLARFTVAIVSGSRRPDLSSPSATGAHLQEYGSEMFLWGGPARWHNEAVREQARVNTARRTEPFLLRVGGPHSVACCRRACV